MNNIKVYSLNVNGFRNDKLENLLVVVRSLIVDVDSIIILQEVPHMYCNKNKQPWSWDLIDKYKVFESRINEEFQIIKPTHLIKSNQCTVAICKKDSNWKSISHEKLQFDNEYNYGNKVVELEYSDKITLLGLHMNPCQDMWDLILDSERKNKHTMIAGDFNAYEYRGEMKKYPQLLRNEGFSSLISSNTITNFDCRSSIDNIYIERAFDFLNGITVKVERLEKFVTDHALCGIELNI